MAAEEELEMAPQSSLFMVSAFLAMEPPDVVLSFARELGEGSITESVQSCICRRCVSATDKKWQGTYLRKFLKKLIGEIEMSGGTVLEELYEHYTSIISSQDDDNNGNSRILKTISFLFPDEPTRMLKCSSSRKFEVRLQCSTNMLEGDTGCSIWPSSLFLSEFILSFPEIFANKCCFEVGSGAGLVGICLSHVKASKVTLSDGDSLTLANMKFNLRLNNLNIENDAADDLSLHTKVQCISLLWESAADGDLPHSPDIILGADVIYDPTCLPHLVRILAILLKQKCLHNDTPIAYIASVIRNEQTFDYFQEVVQQANLKIKDLTQDITVSNLLPYMGSYHRSNVRLFSIRALVN